MQRASDMRFLRRFFVVGALVMPVAASAEQGLSLRAGARATSVREDLLVPLTFSGGGTALAAAYRRSLGPGTLDAHVALGFSVVGNRFGHLGLTAGHALAVDYVVPVYAARGWRWGAGGALGETSDSLALESWDDAHGYWVGVGRVAAIGRAAGPVGSWWLATSAQMALAGTLGRPDQFRRNKQDPSQSLSFYFFDTHRDPRFFTPADVQWADLDVSAHPRASSWSFGCQTRFTRATLPDTIIVLESVIYAGWTWGL